MRELQEQGKLAVPATIQNLPPTLEMREPTADTSLAYAVALLKHYGFELRGYKAEELVERWVKTYSPHWVRMGVIEALYQGRYKAVSVEQILAVWTRRGQPIHRFNHEFERLISRKLPQKLTDPRGVRSSNRGDNVNTADVVLSPALNLNADRELARLQELAVASPLDPASDSDSDSAEYPSPELSPLPDPNQDRTLPLVTANFTDTTELDLGQEATEPEPVLTVIQETVPPTEALTKPDVHLHDLEQEAQREISVRHTYEANWSRCEVNKQPIDQFIPPPDSTGFYLKLKAVVQQQEEITPTVGMPITDPGQLLPVTSLNREQEQDKFLSKS